MSGGWRVNQRVLQDSLRASSRPDIPRIGATPSGRLSDTPTAGSSNTNWCNKQIARLSTIDFEQRFKNLLTSARRANVSFYTIDVGGLSLTRSKIEIMRTLAENTDGRAIVNTNDMRAGFRQIADDLSAYYLLGYSSANTALDGRYRQITVKVNQPKVSVTARRGYLAPSPASKLDNARPAAGLIAADVAEALDNLSRSRRDGEPGGPPAAMTKGSALGEPICLLGGPSSRAPLQPATRFEFHRNERLRVEWPRLQTIDERVARVLDRRGQPLPVPATVTEITDNRGGPRLAVDVNFAPFAEGDYVLEFTVNGGHPDQREEHRGVQGRVISKISKDHTVQRHVDGVSEIQLAT